MYPWGVELTEVQQELEGLFAELDGDLEADGEGEARRFFSSIRSAILAADSTAELLAPFQELSTAAFRGFAFGPRSYPSVNLVLDRAYAIASLLAARGETRH